MRSSATSCSPNEDGSNTVSPPIGRAMPRPCRSSLTVARSMPRAGPLVIVPGRGQRCIVDQPPLDGVLVEEHDLLEALGRNGDRLGHAVELEVAERFLDGLHRPRREVLTGDREPVTMTACAGHQRRQAAAGVEADAGIVERRARRGAAERVAGQPERPRVGRVGEPLEIADHVERARHHQQLGVSKLWPLSLSSVSQLISRSSPRRHGPGPRAWRHSAPASRSPRRDRSARSCTSRPPDRACPR